MQLGDYRLTARYDLLAIEPRERAVIVDWKTSKIRSRRIQLEKRWQTRLYRYVLAKAGAQLNNGKPFEPKQIELIYWFANYPAQVERFPYDAAQYKATGQVLAVTIAEIAARAQERWTLTEDVKRCRYCTYRTLCGREKVKVEEQENDTEEQQDPFDLDLDLEQIAEIEF
jgi:CRISPR/Cas system-associated exonuclease Cas4 (RecB family)